MCVFPRWGFVKGVRRDVAGNDIVSHALTFAGGEWVAEAHLVLFFQRMYFYFYQKINRPREFCSLILDASSVHLYNTNNYC